MIAIQKQRKVNFITLGCKINQYDSNSIATSLKEQDYIIVNNRSEADIVVINTCTVTGKTNHKARQQIRKTIQENPKAVLIVTGCYAQVQAEQIANIPGVDYIVGNTEKSKIASLFSSCTKQTIPEIVVGNIFDEKFLDPGPLKTHSGTTRAFLKIQDGCNHACSYCVIPQARGRSRSLLPAHVENKISEFMKSDFLEVVLCGIHLGLYGHDLNPSTSLLELLTQLENESRPHRIRISSIEPNELTDEILSLFFKANHLCPHFHLPLQSGDAGILKAMNRPYAPADFINLVNKIHKQLPDAAIGVDLISGFPGEEERAFQNTIALLEELPISYFHVFPFSVRPGTPASSLPNQVKPEIIHKRAELLRKLGQKKRMEFYNRFLNKEVEVLIETKRDPKTGLLKGISRNYIPVLFEGSDDLQRRCLKIKICDIQGKEIFGEICAKNL